MSNVTPIRQYASSAVAFAPGEPSTKLVGLLSAPSRLFASFDVLFRSGDVLLDYTFWSKDVLRESGIHFGNVLAFQRRADIYCTAWHLTGHDKVVEIVDSEWVHELREAAELTWREHWNMRHFLVYIDGEGAFEVIAEEVLLTPDVAV